VKFCHRIGLTYVSCSPFRVPVARLAAAQAALEELAAKSTKINGPKRVNGAIKPKARRNLQRV
jgi:pyruvate,orthophosphate dikinase